MLPEGELPEIRPVEPEDVHDGELRSGWSAATASMASAWAKPTASTTAAPRPTIRRIACSALTLVW